MAKDDKDIMSALRRAIADKVGNERYSLWFGPRTRFAWNGTELSVYAPNPFYREWIQTVFAGAIEEACQSVIGYVPTISFYCASEGGLMEVHDAAACEEPIAVESRTREPRKPARTRSTVRKPAPTPQISAEELPLFQFASTTEDDESVPETSHSPVNGVASEVIPTRGIAENSEGESRPSFHASREQAILKVNSGAMGVGVLPREASSSEDCGNVPALEESGPRADVVGQGATSPIPGVARNAPPTRGHQPRAALSLSSFIVGDCNRLAFAAADAVVRALGSYSPLVFHGPSGVGKTHLLEGILHAVKQRYPRIAAIYLSAEQFTSAYVEALHKGGIPIFRQKHRGLQLFLLDDLHFLVGKRQTQTELLYTIDSLLKNGCQIVCAADRPPCEIRELGPELVSRLEGGVVCRIDPPDYEVRIQIVARLVSESGIALSPEVQAWIAERFAKNVRQLIGAARRLEAAGKALKRPLDVRLAEEILADMLGDAQSQIRFPDIEREVCLAFGLPEGALQTNRKDREITYPRMLAMWLARKYTRANLAEIGRYFGKRSHATVISAQKKVETWMREGHRLPSVKGERAVSEMLKELERRLRAS
ncbi:MAG TPA: DnaA/Hda family protein [Thermogutta sp.]|nr:DnaA/Hda family protein [Thermogutta sp.]